MMEWWHWMVAGLALMLAELAIPAFFLIWFGLGAMIVGVAMLAYPPLPLVGQVMVWTLASLIFVVVWLRVFRANAHRTRVGFSKGQFDGEIGLVTRDIRPFERGLIRFQKPILGAEVWEAIAEQEIRAGARVRVLDVEGNLLRVAADR